jgi:cysteine desulfurase
LVHTDAAQSLGKVPVNVDDLGVDLLTVAGHKLYAPKGIGVLYVRRGVKLEPLIHGASHESGRRAVPQSFASSLSFSMPSSAMRKPIRKYAGCKSKR